MGIDQVEQSPKIAFLDNNLALDIGILASDKPCCSQNLLPPNTTRKQPSSMDPINFSNGRINYTIIGILKVKGIFSKYSIGQKSFNYLL